MRRPDYDVDYRYDESEPSGRLSPLAPAALWGMIMAAALAGAGFAVWRAQGAPEQRLVSGEGSENVLRRDVARLGAERDALAGRVATLERGLGEMKLAQRDAATDTTGSIGKAGPGFAVSLGIEPSADAAKRRWSALSSRFPTQLARLAPLLRKEPGRTPLFDLVAGPFRTRADADRTCGALAEQGLACDTTEYAGDPIGR